MRPNARLDVAHKAAVTTTNAGQATVSATRRDGRGIVHLAMLRKQRGASQGVTALDLTIPQAMRLRAVLAEAIRAACPDDAALSGIPEVDSAASGAAGEDRQHVGTQGAQAA